VSVHVPRHPRVDDEAHMVWGCPALVDQRVQHSELFEDSNITSVADFMQQDAGQLAAFLRGCHDQCASMINVPKTLKP
jgi:hypothetical protein